MGVGGNGVRTMGGNGRRHTNADEHTNIDADGNEHAATNVNTVSKSNTARDRHAAGDPVLHTTRYATTDQHAETDTDQRHATSSGDGHAGSDPLLYATADTSHTNLVRRVLMRQRFFIVGGLLTALAAPSFAVTYTWLPIDPAACMSLNAGSRSCQKLQYDHTQTGRGQDDVRACQQGDTHGFVCKFQWPHSNPGQVVPQVLWDVGPGGATTGFVCWQASIGCVGTNEEYQTFTYGITQNASVETNPSPTHLAVATIPATTPVGNAADVVCKVKIERVANLGGCLDSMSDPARVLWIQLGY